jgi:hypothetical protein
MRRVLLITPLLVALVACGGNSASTTSSGNQAPTAAQQALVFVKQSCALSVSTIPKPPLDENLGVIAARARQLGLQLAAFELQRAEIVVRAAKLDPQWDSLLNDFYIRKSQWENYAYDVPNTQPDPLPRIQAACAKANA